MAWRQDFASLGTLATVLVAVLVLGVGAEPAAFGIATLGDARVCTECGSIQGRRFDPARPIHSRVAMRKRLGCVCDTCEECSPAQAQPLAALLAGVSWFQGGLPAVPTTLPGLHITRGPPLPLGHISVRSFRQLLAAGPVAALAQTAVPRTTARQAARAAKESVPRRSGDGASGPLAEQPQPPGAHRPRVTSPEQPVGKLGDRGVVEAAQPPAAVLDGDDDRAAKPTEFAQRRPPDFNPPPRPGGEQPRVAAALAAHGDQPLVCQPGSSADSLGGHVT
jgi:hypothetical protein